MSTLLLSARPSSSFASIGRRRTTVLSSSRLFSSVVDDDPPPLVIDGQRIRYAMAPMVAASDYAFRRLVRQYCDNDDEPPILCYTQMLHAKHMVQKPAFRRSHMDFCSWKDDNAGELLPSQENCLRGLDASAAQAAVQRPHEEGGPLMVQLAGSDPNMVVDAAHVVLEMSSDDSVAGIDINLGCPQGIARKGRYGAFLMEEDPELVCEILSKLRQSLPSNKLVSAKIRLPLDPRELTNRITMLVDQTGIDFLTIHGRDLKENKTKVGPVHADKVQLAIQTARAIRPDFPIIMNGGIEQHECIAPLLKQTGASAVMSSEGLLERPNLFATPVPTTDDERKL